MADEGDDRFRRCVIGFSRCGDLEQNDIEGGMGVINSRRILVGGWVVGVVPKNGAKRKEIRIKYGRNG